MIRLICVVAAFIRYGSEWLEVKAVTIWNDVSGRAEPGAESFQHSGKIMTGPDSEKGLADSTATRVSASAFGLGAGCIEIPVSLRGLPIEQLPVSARLSGVLERSKIRVLGDLHGRSFDELARQRNCGIKTLRELGAALCLARYSGEAVLAQVAASAAASCTFMIPESVGNLEFADLPSSTRLETMVRKFGMRSLSDLQGRNAIELLRCSNVGVGTIVEIQRLLARASNGEFNGAPVEPSAAPAALLTLVEAGLALLETRDRDLLLDRIGARGTGAATLEQLARDYHLTRERVRQITQETVSKLRKTWGPRIPYLLEVVKARCLSKLCPLSPDLLEHWIKGFEARLQLESATHVRLIGALDREFPCWPAGRATVVVADDSLDNFIQSLLAGASAVHFSDAFRAVIAQDNLRGLSFSDFLRRLARMRDVVSLFDQPEDPALRLCRPNDVGNLSLLGSLPARDRSPSRPERRLDSEVRPAA